MNRGVGQPTDPARSVQGPGQVQGKTLEWHRAQWGSGVLLHPPANNGQLLCEKLFGHRRVERSHVLVALHSCSDPPQLTTLRSAPDSLHHKATHRTSSSHKSSRQVVAHLTTCTATTTHGGSRGPGNESKFPARREASPTLSHRRVDRCRRRSKIATTTLIAHSHTASHGMCYRQWLRSQPLREV